jgi:hypothetical protein
MILKTISIMLILAAFGGACDRSDSSPETSPEAKLPTTKLNESYEKFLEKERQLYHWPADFDLPLVIEMEAPEVPPEVVGPFPLPTTEKSQPANEESPPQEQK